MDPEKLRHMTIRVAVPDATEDDIKDAIPSFLGKPVIVQSTGERIGEVCAAAYKGDSIVEAEVSIDAGKVMRSYKEINNLSVGFKVKE